MLRTRKVFVRALHRQPTLGSVDVLVNNAAVWTDPPIMRLEPADGIIVPGNQPLSVFEFVYPENPYMLRPLVLRSHFDGAPVVFQIENVIGATVAWRSTW